MFYNSPLFNQIELPPPSLSEEGRYLVFGGYIANEKNIWLYDTTRLSSPRPLIKQKIHRICSLRWSNCNERIIYAQDHYGDENQEIFSVNIHTNVQTSLTPEGYRSQVIAQEATHPFRILVSIDDAYTGFPNLYLVDCNTGQRELVLKNDRYGAFICDHNGRERLAILNTSNGGYEIHDLHSNKECILKVPHKDRFTTTPLQLSKDGFSLFLLDSIGSPTPDIARVDLKTGEKICLIKHTVGNIEKAIIDPETDKLDAYLVSGTKDQWFVKDPDLNYALSSLKACLKSVWDLTDRSRDKTCVLIKTEEDQVPPKFILYKSNTGIIQFDLFNNNLTSTFKFNKMKGVHILTEKKEPLLGYLTSPKISHPSEPRAMILLVHGGPQMRDRWCFNFMHQWLSSLGYCVLSVNYRGSTGFGKDFIEDSHGHWATRVQDDLRAAVNWAIDREVTQPEKIAIMGWSFGGYSSLMALATHPEIFSCGISFSGTADLLSLYRNAPPFWEPLKPCLKKRICGESYKSKTDNSMLKNSPQESAGNIRKPLLILHGERDPIIKIDQVSRMVEHIQLNSTPLTYITFKNEGHCFEQEENKRTSLIILERFLNAHCAPSPKTPYEKVLRNQNMRLRTWDPKLRIHLD